MVNGPGTVILIVRVGVGAQEFDVAHLDRMLAPHLADDARHRIGMAGAVERRAGIVDVDAFERGGEAVGIALAPHLAVGDDVEAGALLVADREQRGIVLRLIQIFRRDPPQLLRAHARRKAAGELLAVDQPFRLGVGADERSGQKRQRHGDSSHLVWPGEAHFQHPRDMQRLAAGAVLDLVPARGAVGNDDGIGRRTCARREAATVRPSPARRRSCRRHSRSCRPCRSSSIRWFRPPSPG